MLCSRLYEEDGPVQVYVISGASRCSSLSELQLQSSPSQQLVGPGAPTAQGPGPHSAVDQVIQEVRAQGESIIRCAHL